MIPPHALYTDGGLCGTNGQAGLVGTYTWLHVDESGCYLRHKSGIVNEGYGKAIENNMVELVALLRGLRSLPEGWHGTVYSDNQNALGWAGLVRRRNGEPWKSDGVPPGLVQVIPRYVGRLGNVRGVHLDGHPKLYELEAGIGHRGNPVSKWNQMCDDHCKAQRIIYALEQDTGDKYTLTKAEFGRLTEDTQACLKALGYGAKKGGIG